MQVIGECLLFLANVGLKLGFKTPANVGSIYFCNVMIVAKFLPRGLLLEIPSSRINEKYLGVIPEEICGGIHGKVSKENP